MSLGPGLPPRLGCTQMTAFMLELAEKSSVQGSALQYWLFGPRAGRKVRYEDLSQQLYT